MNNVTKQINLHFNFNKLNQLIHLILLFFCCLGSIQQSLAIKNSDLVENPLKSNTTKIETPDVCEIPESKITSNPILCGRGVINLKTDFEIKDNINYRYIFVKVNKADDSFEVLRNLAVNEDNYCYYGIAYQLDCDVPDFKADSFSIILNADANYTVTDCFEIERAEAPFFSISTQPYCIGNGLFTVGITLSGSSGKYIIGIDYSGNEVEGVTGENFITFRSGEAFYALRPTDAITGCSNDFGLSIIDPGCGCICPAVVAPVCGEDGETYGNKCLAACAGVTVAYSGACNYLPEIFITYEWLSDYVNPNSCVSNTKVTVYKGGFYNFVYIYYADGNESIHFEDGTLICKNGEGFSCLDLFNFGKAIETWTCNGIIVNNNPFIVDYPWLNSKVDLNNCNETILKEYNKGILKYILVETEVMSSLYYQNGILFCSDEDAFMCVEKFRLPEPTQIWVCEDGNNKEVINSIDNPFKVFPNPNSGYFELELNKSNTKAQTINVLDMNNKIIHTKLVEPNQKNATINLSNVAKGIYWIQLISTTNTHTERIILR